MNMDETYAGKGLCIIMALMSALENDFFFFFLKTMLNLGHGYKSHGSHEMIWWWYEHSDIW